jgi:hypothetical protein
MAPMFSRASRGTDLSHGDTALADSFKAVDHIHATCRELAEDLSVPAERQPGRGRRIHGQRARPVPPDLLCSRGATSRRSARSPQLRGTRNFWIGAGARRGPANDNVLRRRTLAEGLASVSISGPKGTNRPCLRAMVGTDTRNHNPRVGGWGPSSGIVVNTLISSVHGRSRTLAA